MAEQEIQLQNENAAHDYLAAVKSGNLEPFIFKRETLRPDIQIYRAVVFRQANIRRIYLENKNRRRRTNAYRWTTEDLNVQISRLETIRELYLAKKEAKSKK
jgi:hypothetical protein